MIYKFRKMSKYNKEAYLKFKEENPDKLKQHSKKAYEKMKNENPDKLKEYRQNAYNKYKEANLDKLREIRREASKRYYETHKEELALKYKLKKEMKSIAINGTFEVDTEINKENVDSVTIVKGTEFPF